MAEWSEMQLRLFSYDSFIKTCMCKRDARTLVLAPVVKLPWSMCATIGEIRKIQCKLQRYLKFDIYAMNKVLTQFRISINYVNLQKRFIKYVQGQEPEPKIREYFYYIDHQGMLFLDDSKMKNFTSCFKEKKFLEFFFKRIRINKTGRYEKQFPFISLCGRERNFIRCDDVPIVYTHIISKSIHDEDLMTFGYASELLTAKFQPEKVYMLPKTGRVYHPAEDKYGGIGLIRSKLAIEISKNFTFKNGELKPPTHFNWKKKNYELDQSWFSTTIDKYNINVKSIPD